MIPTALQVGECESGTPLDTPLDDQVDENAPDSHPDAGGPDGQNEDEGQATAAERLLEATPEHAFDDDQLDESAYSLRRECLCPGNTPAFINIHQLRTEV